jgi:hypothetical protein
LLDFLADPEETFVCVECHNLISEKALLMMPSKHAPSAICSVSLVPIVIFLIVPLSHAAVMYDDLNADPGGAFQISDSQSLAVELDVQNSAVQLDSIQFGMGDTTGNRGSFFVALFSNTGAPNGVPDTAIETLTGPNPTTAGTYTFTSSGTVLSANTTYWIVASGSENKAYSLNFNSTDPTVSGIDSSGEIPVRSGPFDHDNISSTHINMRVNGALVPEPSTVVLGIIGAGLVIGYLRK